MLYKSLVSFIVAIAVTSAVAVSASPAARGGNGGSTTSECNTGSVACCDQVVSGNDPSATSLGGLLGINIPVDVPVGLNCISVISSVQW
jgi:hypothetical protein